MDTSVAMTPIQLLFVWMLIGGVIFWMVFFTGLALQPGKKNKKISDDLRASSQQRAHISTAPMRQPAVARSIPAHIGTKDHRTTGEVEALSVS